MMENKGTLLLVEDETDAGEMLRDYLQMQGYTVHWYTDGQVCATALPTLLPAPNIAVLDVMVPGMDGHALMAVLRGMPAYATLPIILLTAKDRETDVVEGLVGGADAYIRKPAGFPVVLAHVETLLRRMPPRHIPRRHEYGPLVLDEDRQQAYHSGQDLHLTPTEYQVLALMLAEPERVFSRESLLEILDPGKVKRLNERTVDAHMKNLRAKLGTLGNLISTVRGVGYSLNNQAYAAHA